MAGAKFLNQQIKIAICAVGMLCMGYLLYPALAAGEVTDRITIGRGLVFLAFTFFLVRNLVEVLRRSPRGQDDPESEPTV
jgi:hypothetical protein